MSFKQEMVRTYTAEGTIARGVFVKFGSSDNQVLQCGAGEDMIGIAQNDVVAGDACEVAQMGGGAEILLGATLARGAFVQSDANGKAVALTTGNRSGAMLSESGVLDDLVGCEVNLFDPLT